MLSQSLCCPCSLCASPHWCQGARMLLITTAPHPLPPPAPACPLGNHTKSPQTSPQSSQALLAPFPIHKQPWQLPSPPQPLCPIIGELSAGLSPLPAPKAQQNIAPQPTPKINLISNFTGRAEGLTGQA